MKRTRAMWTAVLAGVLVPLVALPATQASSSSEAAASASAGSHAVPIPEECSTTTYDGFGEPQPAPLTYNEAAEVVVTEDGTVLRVTPNEQGRVGSAFTTAKVNLVDDASFSTKFAFRFSGQTEDQGNVGGDGLVFTVQNVANNVGGSGGGIGYQGIDQSIGVEFDSWVNGEWNDINDNHVGIDIDGSVISEASADLSPIVLDDPAVVHHAWVDYNGATDELEVRVADVSTRPSEPTLSHIVPLPEILGEEGAPADDAFLGFTSGTGALSADHDVLSWQFSNCHRPIGTNSAPFVDAGGPYTGDVDTAVGIAGSASDDLTTPLPSEWSYTGPGTCSFDDPSAVTTAVTCDQPGSYMLSLSADDGANPVVSDTAALGLIDPEARIAFTDDRDELDLIGVERDESESDVDFWSHRVPFEPEETTHQGEASADLVSDQAAYVSTRDHDDNGADDPDGEVYIADVTLVNEEDEGLDFHERVTCNDALETHPTLLEGGDWIAWASDIDGDWEIYVAQQPDDPADENEVGGVCAGWEGFQVTDHPGDDLWPTWNGDDGSYLVFSSTRHDPLGDIYLVVLDDGEAFDVYRQTDDPGADTQPAVAPGSPDEIAFTTTRWRPDGSIAFVHATFNDEVNEVVSAWGGTADPDPDDVPQSSEPAWSEDGTHVAFTSTDDDPYGDIWIAAYDDELLDPTPIADTPGVAESHPTWRNRFDEPPIIIRPAPFRPYQPPTASSSSVSPAAEPPAGVEEVDYAELLFTRRSHDADVSEVGLDGRGFNVVVDKTDDDVDEAGPSYSPDGQRVAYSAAVGEGLGRTIRTASTLDGSAVQDLAALTEHRPEDIDRDPVWSPDGTRIAFVREPAGDGFGPPRVLVVDLDAEPGEALTRITPPSGDFVRYRDWDPDWSPDGTQLVLVRDRDFFGARKAPGRISSARAGILEPVEEQLWVVPADGSGPGHGLVYDYCSDGCYSLLRGRGPTWSPDGSDTIAYSYRGQIETVTFFPDEEESFLFLEEDEIQMTEPVYVTGFDRNENGDGTPRNPSPAAAVLSRADDPVWSPDGTELAFSGQPAGQPDQRGIWVIAPDGNGLRPVTNDEGHLDDEPPTRGPQTEPDYGPRPEADVAVTVAISGSPAEVDTPLVATFKVTNLGPDPATQVALSTTFTAGATKGAVTPPAGCRTNGTGCDFAMLPGNKTRTYKVRLRHAVPVAGTATGTVTAATPDPDLTNNVASAPYRVVKTPVVEEPDVLVKVKLDEPVGYVGGFRTATIKVRNKGPVTAEDVTVQATWPEERVTAAIPEPEPDGPPVLTPECLPEGDVCDLGDLAAGEKINRRVSLEVLELDEDVLEDTATIEALVTTASTDSDADNNEHSVDLEILQPTIRLLPGVARPGQAVLAYGENMPPGTEVTVVWDVGIRVDPGPLTVGDDGRARTPVVIVRHDLLGERVLTATSTTDEFTPVEGDLLVVLRTLAPPQLVGRG